MTTCPPPGISIRQRWRIFEDARGAVPASLSAAWRTSVMGGTSLFAAGRCGTPFQFSRSFEVASRLQQRTQLAYRAQRVELADCGDQFPCALLTRNRSNEIERLVLDLLARH